MKFLQVYCESRNTLVYINIEKVVLLSKSNAQENGQEVTLIEVDGLNDNKGAVRVATPAEELIKMINGDDKVRIGFRTSN